MISSNLQYLRQTGKEKYQMEFVKIIDNDKTKYMDLLLIADEQADMIEKYLYRGEMFALRDDNEIKAVCIVTQEQPGIYEIKNIAVVPQYQRKGYRRKLISFIADYCKNGAELYVGTGDTPATLHFYEKCGFEKSHVVKNFFTDNYDHPIYENGQQLMDMIYLKRKL